MTDTYISIPTVTDPNLLNAEALDWLMANYPGWIPREGHLEVALVEVVSRLIAANRDIASAVPASIFRYAGKGLHGIPSIDASSATVTSTWTVVDDAGYTIPPNTLVGFQLTADTRALFQTVTAVTIAPGQTSTSSGEVVLRALRPGAAYNNIQPGPIDLVDALAFVRTVVTTSVTAGGADAETDSAYLDRLREELKVQGRPTLPYDFEVRARRIAGVDRALAIDGYDPTDGTYNNERTIAVALADKQGNAVTTVVASAVRAYLEAQREVNFVINTIDPTYTILDVTATVRALPGFDTNAVQAACVAAIKAYLDPANWDWDTTVRVNELEYVLRNVPGVRYVDALTEPSTNVILQGVAALVEAGAVSITVEAAT